MLPFVALVLVHWYTLPPVFAGDYAQYILHAKALVEGRPYGDTGYIFTPLRAFVGPPLLPPGLPLTIAPVVAIGGTGTPLLKGVMILSALAFLVAVWKYHLRHQSVWTALAAVAFTGAAIEASYASVMVLSDLGFCALIWWFVYIADLEGRWSGARIAGLIAIGLAAVAYRVAGIVLAPAIVLWVALNYRRVGFRPLIIPAVWGVLGILATRQHVFSLLPSRLFDPSLLVTSITSRPLTYRTVVFDALLYPFPIDVLNDVYHVVAVAAVGTGILLLAWKHGRSFAASFVAAYTAMLFVVPVSDARYLWPLFPIIGAAFVHGGAWLLRLAWRRRPVPVMQHLFGLGIVVSIVVAATLRLTRIPDPPSLLGNVDVQALFERIRETVPRTARVVFMNPRVFALETGLPSMSLFATPEEGRSLAVLERNGITHVVAGDLGLHPRVAVATEQMINEAPDRFELLYRNSSFRLYRFRPADDRTTEVRTSMSEIERRADLSGLAARAAAKWNS